jgi:uncharacterized delta-60 repeat protein
MRKRRCSEIFLAFFVAALLSAAPAVGWGGVDRSFGLLGLVRPDPALPGYQFQNVERMAAEPAGGIYLLNFATNCGAGGCSWDLYLTRRKPNGGRDGAFAGGHGARLVFAGDAGPFGDLTTDRKGRAIVAVPEPGAVFLARLNPGGGFDRSFGDGGRITLPCNCRGGSPIIRTDRTGRVYLALGWTEYPPNWPFEGAIQSRLLAARLRPNGQPDPSFGQGGWSEIEPGEGGSPEQIFVRHDGSLLLAGGDRCCGSSEGMYLLRVQPDGTFDSAFAARADADLRTLGLAQPTGMTMPMAMLGRPHEAVDLLGHTEDSGFVLRFRGDGSLERRFANGGARFLPWKVTDAARLEDGRVVVAGSEVSFSGLLLSVLNANGSIDRSFHRGAPLELSRWSPFGPELAMQRGKRTLLFETGIQGCRQYCPPEPKLMRFLPPRHRG